MELWRATRQTGKKEIERDLKSSYINAVKCKENKWIEQIIRTLATGTKAQQCYKA